MKLSRPISQIPSNQLARESMSKQCQEESNIDRWPAPYQFCMDLISRLSGLSRSFAIILLETGCRPVEALNLCAANSHPNGQILITSAKNGQDRISSSPYFRRLLPKENLNPDFKPFAHYSYKKFYRAVMSTGMIISSNKLVHVPVSRLFRQAHASIAQLLSENRLDVIAHTLGHKQSKNAEFYIQQKG